MKLNLLRPSFALRQMSAVPTALWVFMAAGATGPLPAWAQAASPPAASAPAANDYTQGAAWLCRPGRQDACAVDLTTTRVTPEGKASRETAPRPAQPAVDCFYVYPTVSGDAAGNADMNPGDEEQRAAESQFARFSTLCRPYAPLYRQVTLKALRSRMTDTITPADSELPYRDVLDAWNHYLKHDNKGRGVVLIGHSQGARVLTELLEREIEGKPVHKRLVSALLMGANFEVPRGKDVGASAKKTPLCRAATQTGCVIAFVSFRATEGLPDNVRFGHASEGNEVACTNPAALAGGQADLKPYLLARSGRMADVLGKLSGSTIDTLYVSPDALGSAECVSRPEINYLSVRHNPAFKAQRIDIPGDVRIGHRVLGDWGLHVAEVDLTMGNLIEVVGQQVKAFQAHAK